MRASSLSAGVAGLCLVIGVGAYGQQAPPESSKKQPHTKDGHKVDILKSVIGAWEGTCRTWFEPGKLADESTVKGEFKPLLGGRFVRHTYEGSMKGKPRTGEETIVFNSVEKEFQVAWFDDFHMNYALLFSEGERTAKGFSVTGKYDVAPGKEPWGWRTEYELIDNDHLTITAYNVTPDGEEAKAVETVYTRKPKSE